MEKLLLKQGKPCNRNIEKMEPIQGNPCSLNPVERKKIMKIKTKTHNYRAIPVQ